MINLKFKKKITWYKICLKFSKTVSVIRKQDVKEMKKII